MKFGICKKYSLGLSVFCVAVFLVGLAQPVRAQISGSLLTSSDLFPQKEIDEALCNQLQNAKDEALSKISGGAKGALEGVLGVLGTSSGVPVNVDRISDSKFNLKLQQLIDVTKAIQRGIGGPSCVDLASVVNGVADAAGTVQDIAKETASLASETISSALGFVSGTPTESLKLSAEAKATILAWSKAKTELAALQARPAPKNLNEAVKRQSQIDLLTAKIDAHNRDLNNIKVRLNASLKDYARAFVLGLIQDLSRKMTNHVVNAIVSKYHISNYLAYADAVANQVYAIDYIKKNFPDNDTQFIVGSLYRGIHSKLPSRVTAAEKFIQAKAQAYGGRACKGDISVTDPNFYFSMARCGDVEANPAYQNLVAREQVAQANAAAKQAAAQDIASGKGFQSGYDCTNTISQQKQIDSRVDQLSQQTTSAFNVWQLLLKSRASKKDIDKAYADWQATQAQYAGLANRESNSTLLDICKGITNPGGLVQDQINNIINNNLNKTNTLRPENLPSYLLYLKNVTSDLLLNLVFGKGNKGYLLKQAGLEALGAFSSGILDEINKKDTTVTLPSGQQGSNAAISISYSPKPAIPNNNVSICVDISKPVEQKLNLTRIKILNVTENYVYYDEKLLTEDIQNKKACAEGPAPQKSIKLVAQLFGLDPDGKQQVFGESAETEILVKEGLVTGTAGIRFSHQIANPGDSITVIGEFNFTPKSKILPKAMVFYVPNNPNDPATTVIKTLPYRLNSSEINFNEGYAQLQLPLRAPVVSFTYRVEVYGTDEAGAQDVLLGSASAKLPVNVPGSGGTASVNSRQFNKGSVAGANTVFAISPRGAVVSIKPRN